MNNSKIINWIIFIVLIQSALLVYIQYKSNQEREILIKQVGRLVLIDKVIEDNYKRNQSLSTDMVLGDRCIV